MNIGLLGKAGAGKDTFAGLLMAQRTHQRYAFADPLKLDVGRELFPTIGEVVPDDATLLKLIEATKHLPFVRRRLQDHGTAMREEHGAAYWIDRAFDRIAAEASADIAVVITDVRYPNEVRALEARGFLLIRIERPGAGLSGAAAIHGSETLLDDYTAPYTIANDGEPAAMLEQLDRILATR